MLSLKIIQKLDTSNFHENDIIVIGLSGGADSVALTHMLNEMCQKLTLSLAACHVNHCLRGEESERDSRFVQNFCEELKIPLYIKRVDIKALSLEQGISVEECGRKVRYDFFEQTAKMLETENHKRAHIVTAHNLSDNVETVIFNLTRGTALKGLCGIPSVRDDGRIVRPMINITRNEVEQYCSENNLSYVTDSSNLLDIYARNNIRHRVVPVLKEINPALESKVWESIDILLLEQDFMEKYAREKYASAYGEIKGHGGLYVSRISGEHKAILRRIVAIFLQENSTPVTKKNVELVVEIVGLGHGQHNILQGKFISVNKSGLLVCETKEFFRKTVIDKDNCCMKILPENGTFKSKTGKTYKVQTLSMITSESFNKIYKKLFAIFLDCGKICGSAILRERMPGDKIKLTANTSTKTLKNLFQEKEIDVMDRPHLFVISDDSGILAVEGIGTSVRAQCDNNTTKMIVISENDL